MTQRNSSVLLSLLGSWILQCLNGTREPPSSVPQGLNQGLNQASNREQDQGMIYLVLMVGLFSFFTFGIMLSYIRSRKVEGSNDPYHQYIVRDWTRPLVLASPALPQGVGHQEPVVLGNSAVLEALPE
ncbi:potassium voltage-gated channel subfamily E member 1-like [Scleropages formosus]|nr:potassium voltage-gated channel subfamily E member 1-like [Scleropages formosus]